MQSSKSTAIMFLLGAILVGGALGFTADRVMLRDRLAKPPAGRALLADKLQLDAGQRTRLDSILDDRNRRLSIINATVRPALDSIKSEARDEIRLLLNPTQRSEFEKLLAEMRDPNKSHDDN